MNNLLERKSTCIMSPAPQLPCSHPNTASSEILTNSPAKKKHRGHFLHFHSRGEGLESIYIYIYIDDLASDFGFSLGVNKTYKPKGQDKFLK